MYYMYCYRYLCRIIRFFIFKSQVNCLLNIFLLIQTVFSNDHFLLYIIDTTSLKLYVKLKYYPRN